MNKISDSEKTKRYQKRNIRKGLCRTCGKLREGYPPISSQYCLEHLQHHREIKRVKSGYKIRHLGSRSYVKKI